MNGITVSPDDVLHHVVSIGLDTFPSIEMRHERTRLNMFFEEVRETVPYASLLSTVGLPHFARRLTICVQTIAIDKCPER